MNILSILIIIFVFLEGSNVFFLYFLPETRLGNGIGIFNAYEKSKSDPEVHALVKYLVNWLAGTKLIFIALLIVILFKGDESIQLFSLIALTISVATFFWRLYPMIRSMDREGQITPRGYSRTLAMMIAGFMAVFVLGAVGYLMG